MLMAYNDPTRCMKGMWQCVSVKVQMLIRIPLINYSMEVFSKKSDTKYSRFVGYVILMATVQLCCRRMRTATDICK